MGLEGEAPHSGVGLDVADGFLQYGKVLFRLAGVAGLEEVPGGGEGGPMGKPMIGHRTVEDQFQFIGPSSTTRPFPVSPGTSSLGLTVTQSTPAGSGRVPLVSI